MGDFEGTGFTDPYREALRIATAEEEAKRKREKATHASNLSRSRGYNFEYKFVNKFMELDGWNARRLGGSSTGLPDIVAVNNSRGILVTIECKSGEADKLWIPDDQIERCRTVMQFFSYYPYKFFVPAFKFKGLRKRRKLSYRFDLFNMQEAERLVGALSYSYNQNKISGTLETQVLETGASAIKSFSHEGLSSFDDLIERIYAFSKSLELSP